MPGRAESAQKGEARQVVEQRGFPEQSCALPVLSAPSSGLTSTPCRPEHFLLAKTRFLHLLPSCSSFVPTTMRDSQQTVVGLQSVDPPCSASRASESALLLIRGQADVASLKEQIAAAQGAPSLLGRAADAAIRSVSESPLAPSILERL